jgi:hypothetical protein
MLRQYRFPVSVGHATDTLRPLRRHRGAPRSGLTLLLRIASCGCFGSADVAEGLIIPTDHGGRRAGGSRPIELAVVRGGIWASYHDLVDTAPRRRPVRWWSGPRVRPAAHVSDYRATDGHRTVITTESSSACHVWSMPGPHMA